MKSALNGTNVSGTDEGIGFVMAFVAIVGFGSCMVPTKLTPSGDGLFFQWCFSVAIYCTGLVYGVASRSAFYPFAMVGGALWCLGNATAVPIIHAVGLGLGLLMWTVSALMTGWFLGTFGIPGYLDPSPIQRPILNYVGLAVAASSFGLYLLVNTEVPSTTRNADNEGTALLSVNATTPTSPSVRTKILGALASLGAGVLYGINAIPVSILAQMYPEKGPFEFAMSHFSGILLTSTVLFLIYAIWKRNQPVIEPRLVLGALGGGTLWGIAQCSLFAADDFLSLSVAYPLVATGPAIVGNLWGVFFFKEVRGAANLLKLVLAFAVTATGIVLISLSK